MDPATAIGIGGSLLGGAIGGKGAKKAAKAQAKAQMAAVAEQRRQYDTTRQDLMPWMETGRNALGRLDSTSRGDMSHFQASPGYEFRRSEGQRGIGNSFAARGGAFSGNALRALTDFNSNLASGEFGNWWNQQAGLAGVGQSATNASGTFGANAAGNIGNALMGAGDARASGIVGGANALTQGISGAIDTWNYFRKPRGVRNALANNYTGPRYAGVV